MFLLIPAAAAAAAAAATKEKDNCYLQHYTNIVLTKKI